MDQLFYDPTVFTWAESTLEMKLFLIARRAGIFTRSLQMPAAENAERRQVYLDFVPAGGADEAFRFFRRHFIAASRAAGRVYQVP